VVEGAEVVSLSGAGDLSSGACDLGSFVDRVSFGGCSDTM
jgi:hypothetical protein